MLTGRLVLALTGTASFDEDVVGTCGADGAGALAMTLDDGSAVLLAADETGARLTVTAPGVVLENDVVDVRTQRDGESIVLAASLFHARTSESTGSLDLEATCG
ncbi:hypothetical protein F1C76_04790 [Geodermatophilaceae bacterium NBWT11]|nr:hypothetical protein F1C76_04790 [Geodermatophilaceae bacterium NBWT11]